MRTLGLQPSFPGSLDVSTFMSRTGSPGSPWLLSRQPVVAAPPVSAPDILRPMETRSFRDAGGTPGGLGHFLLGCIMACIGGYLLINQVTVVGSYWNFYGENAFGITLLPMLFGIGLLFWRGRSILGWILTIAGALFIFAGILANLHIYFRPSSLFNTLVMLVLLVGGLGLIARGIQPHPKPSGE
jgi:hypothetical protein